MWVYEDTFVIQDIKQLVLTCLNTTVYVAYLVVILIWQFGKF